MQPEQDTEIESQLREGNLAQETISNLRAVKQDFFATKSELLLGWCRQKRIFSKADLLRYGLDNFYLRCDRTVRSWVREGLVRRLSEREKEQAAERQMELAI